MKSTRAIRLDLAAIYSKIRPFLVVLTDVRTGEAIYPLTTARDLEHLLTASRTGGVLPI